MTDVFRCVFSQDALVIKSMLDAEGIPSELLNGDMLDLNPLFQAAIGSTRIVVADADAEDARLVVASYRDSGSSEAGDR